MENFFMPSFAHNSFFDVDISTFVIIPMNKNQRHKNLRQGTKRSRVLSSYDLKFNLFEFSYLEYNMNMCVGWHPWHNQHKKVFICVLLSCVSL